MRFSNLPPINSKTIRGWETNDVGEYAERYVTSALKKLGYRTKESEDILVNGKTLVEVKTSKERFDKKGKMYWSPMLPFFKGEYDILAVVFQRKGCFKDILYFTSFAIENLVRAKCGLTIRRNCQVYKLGTHNFRLALKRHNFYKKYGI